MRRIVDWKRIAVRLVNAVESGEVLDEHWIRRVQRAVKAVRLAQRAQPTRPGGHKEGK